MIILFDIDGTIADCSHRLHYLENKDWDNFYAEAYKDQPIVPIIQIAMCMSSYHDVVFCTGRPEKYREMTKEWMWKNGLGEVSGQDGYHMPLLMRHDGDCRPDYVVKPELIRGMEDEIGCIFEDRDQMVKEWRKRGFFCVQVADGKY